MTVRVWLRVVGAALLSFAAGASQSLAASADEKKPAVPFYRKYLVPGNKLDDQIIEQEQRIADAPNDAALHNDMGNLLAARHFAHEAAEHYEQAAKLDKTNFIALYNLGLLREAEGKFSAATSAYHRAVERKHGFPPAHFRLGRMYEKAERLDEAITEYATALRIDPSMRDPKRNPLIVDSELIYRASLANYERDVASATVGKDTIYVEEARFRAVPVDRPVSSQEASGEEPEVVEPRNVGPSDSAGAVGSETGPTGPGPGRGHPAARPTPRAQPARGTRPAPAPAPAPRGGTPLVAAPPGSNVPPPPPVELTPPPSGEPESPPQESMPEPTPAAPVEEEPS
jgi:hypothetical protein